MNTKAVAIARDVLKQIKNWQPIAASGYIRGKPFSNRIQIDSSKQFQEQLPILSKDCQVCALGACFLSYVSLYDEVCPNAFLQEANVRANLWQRRLAASYFNIAAVLHLVFSDKQLLLIESAFECCRPYQENRYSDKTIQEAIDFGKRYKTPKQRLIAIMKNIIKNNGTFIVR